MADTAKISTDQARRLLATLGLPVHQPGTTDGFHATARGGRTGIQEVKAAVRITLHYRYAGGVQLTGRDLDEHGGLDEIREQYRWAVDRAPRHGYTITWEERTAYLTLTRTPPATAPPAPPVAASRPDDRPVPGSVPARAGQRPRAPQHTAGLLPAVDEDERRYFLDTIALAALTVPLRLAPAAVAAAGRGEPVTLPRAAADELARVVLASLIASDPGPLAADDDRT
ncbi:hypothetical protein [Kitasatospora sp. NPDC058046]|uniref:hypothetical protein n=1 Tax=Kitasatospora sp. NPDC058046 TaxID=3346312 RepID=UPI0036DDDF34